MGKTRQRRRQHIQKRKKFEGIENFTYFKFINNNTNYNSNNNKKTERNNNRCSLATDDRVVRRFDGFRTQKNVAVYTQGFGRPSFDMRQPLVGNRGGGWGGQRCRLRQSRIKGSISFRKSITLRSTFIRATPQLK